MVAETVPASLKVSSFKIQESVLDRCQCVIYPYLGGRDCEMIEELRKIFIFTEKASQAIGQLDRVGFRELQEDLAGLQVLADFPI